MKANRRLLALVALSVLLHLLVIGIAARHGVPQAPAPPAPGPIALRLQPLDDRAVPDAAPPPEPLPAPAPALQPVPRPAPDAAPPAAVEDSVPAPQPPPPDPPSDADEPFQAPPRYRVRTPPSATLDYTLTQPDGTRSAPQIAWQTDGSAYTLTADGVMGHASSTGGIGDTGIEPKQSRMRRADGAEASAEFSSAGITIDGHAYPTSIGRQDPASLLLQLAGMGMAVPAQMRDILSVYVATADGPVVMRFRVSDEEEELATPLGNVDTRHLVQLVKPGDARLELWLAPQRRWLPVQLRLTAPDGAVSTQTITRIAD